MKPHVLTRTTAASSPSPRSVQPPAARRAASSSESTSLRAQPRVTKLTVRELDTPRGYVIAQRPEVTAVPLRGRWQAGISARVSRGRGRGRRADGRDRGGGV